jgi:hypothetical protein
LFLRYEDHPSDEGGKEKGAEEVKREAEPKKVN